MNILIGWACLLVVLSGAQVWSLAQSPKQVIEIQHIRLPFSREYVTTTGYCNGPPCTNTTHGLTKSGERVRHGVCAADWSVFPVGTELIIPGYGYCKVLDTGRLVKGSVIDLYFNSAQDARNWGRQVQTIWRITQ